MQRRELPTNTSSSRISKTLRSPLLHFLVVGAAIYVAYAVSQDDVATESPNTITVTAGDVRWMEDSFASRWGRGPTPQERQGLIDTYVRETVLYREAMAMGLDADDTIIRRRLSQKLEFLFQDLADATPPTDEQLREHFAENVDRYQEPELMTFTQVFLDPDRRGEQTLDDAGAILAQLQELPDTTDARALGDPFMLQAYYPERSEAEVAKLFGQEFARSAFELAPSTWHGPVLSGYGVHLVYVHAREQAPPPAYDDVRERVAQDWQTKTRQEFNDEFVASLLERYEIVIEDATGEKMVSN